MAKEGVFNRDAILYEKSEGNIELIEDVVEKRESAVVDILSDADQRALSTQTEFGDKILGDFNIEALNQKEDGKKDPTIIVFVIEDEIRTYKYLMGFQAKVGSRYKIEPYRKIGSGIPFPRMVQEAENAVKKYELDFLIGDQLYMLPDLDHYRESILQQSSSIDKNFRLIISNPCIEIWFHYHYCSDIPDSEEFLKVLERGRPRVMKRYNGRHNNGTGINYSELSTRVDLNIPINNSESNFKLEENNIIPALFSTQMHIVGKVIQGILNENSE